MLRVDRDTDLDDNSEPIWPKDITGVFSQYDTYFPYNHDYQIIPRRYSDIESSVFVKLKIYLEGAYNQSTDNMSSVINNVIPLTSPFSENPRKIQNVPSNIVDWVLIELRSDINGPAVALYSALLHSDGRIVDGTTHGIRMNVSPGEYYIIVKHRNHIPIISSEKVNLTVN